MLCFWSFREARWPALVQKGTMVSGAIVLYQGKRGVGPPALKCCTRRIEAPLSALNFTLPE
jgi:hypothetical protein